PDASKALELVHRALSGERLYTPEGYEAQAEAKAAAQPFEEKRSDLETRKRVAEMSPEEMRSALLTDDLTGLGNRRAYQEAPKKPVQASIDLDSLKFINDN